MLKRPLPPAPQARAQRQELERHGQAWHDDFGWMKAANWREILKDPTRLPEDIRIHLDAENAYTDAVLEPLASLRRTLVGEMRGRIKEDDSGVPEFDGPFGYYTRYRLGGQHPLVCRRQRDKGLEEVLLDGDTAAQGQPFFDLRDADHSPDHRLLAWSADTKGSELFTIRVRDLTSGRDLADEIPATSGEMVWAGDSRTFYYVALDQNHRPARVMRHRLGTPAEADETVYVERDPGFFIDLDVTQSGAWVVIRASNHETSEVLLLARHDPAAQPALVAEREPKVLYTVEHHGHDLLILTNADGAEDFKIVRAPVSAPERANWRDVVPHRAHVMILFHMVLARHLVRLEREDAHPRIVVREIWTGAEHTIDFPEEAFSLALQPGYAFDTGEVRVVYSSMTTPAETYDYDLDSRERTLRKRQEVPSGHDPSRYVTRRLFATAPDGEAVPISVLHRRDLACDGTAPCLLYGYGSYGMAVPAEFRTNPLSLVDRGFVYALAHVRGGTEKGWRWYANGKREHKRNTFTDFVACAEALAAQRFTSAGRIVAHGGSAGGMLMGAVANMAPHLFAGVVADVPFVDVLNTMLDRDLPLTPPEWPEWGNPGESEAAFRTILSYAPYENIRPQAYPAILAVGGLTDPRVTYWEPAKWVARLRATMTGGGPVALRMNMTAGHGGAAGRFERLEDVALIFAFALAAVAQARGTEVESVAA